MVSGILLIWVLGNPNLTDPYVYVAFWAPTYLVSVPAGGSTQRIQMCRSGGEGPRRNRSTTYKHDNGYLIVPVSFRPLAGGFGGVPRPKPGSCIFVPRTWNLNSAQTLRESCTSLNSLYTASYLGSLLIYCRTLNDHQHYGPMFYDSVSIIYLNMYLNMILVFILLYASI